MKKLLGDGHVAVWVALVLLIVFGALRYDNFASAYNLSSFLGYNSMFVLISVGMCLVIMTGGIDLSVGTVAALASVVAAQLSPHGLIVALPAGVAAGLAAGAVDPWRCAPPDCMEAFRPMPAQSSGLLDPALAAFITSRISVQIAACDGRGPATTRTSKRLSTRSALFRWAPRLDLGP